MGISSKAFILQTALAFLLPMAPFHSKLMQGLSHVQLEYKHLRKSKLSTFIYTQCNNFQFCQTSKPVLFINLFLFIIKLISNLPQLIFTIPLTRMPHSQIISALTVYTSHWSIFYCYYYMLTTEKLCLFNLLEVIIPP